MNMCFLWIIALIAFVIIEAATYQLVTIWFAAGSLGGIICALLGAPLYVQIAVFLAVAAATLLLLRPITMKHLKKEPEKTNTDSLIGAWVLITEAVNNIAGTGKGKLCGMEWTVRSENNEEIPEGDLAMVKKIEGVKLIVSKKEE